MGVMMYTNLQNIYLQSQASSLATPQGTVYTIQNAISGLFKNYTALAGSIGLPQNIIYGGILFTLISIMFIALYYIVLSKIFTEPSQQKPTLVLTVSMGILTSLAFGFVAGVFILILAAIIVGSLALLVIVAYRSGQYIYYNAGKMALDAGKGFAESYKNFVSAINDLKKVKAKNPILEQYNTELEGIRDNIEKSIKGINVVTSKLENVTNGVNGEVNELIEKLKYLKNEVAKYINSQKQALDQLQNAGQGQANQTTVDKKTIEDRIRMANNILNFICLLINDAEYLIKEMKGIITSDDPKNFTIYKRLSDVAIEYEKMHREIANSGIIITGFDTIDNEIRRKIKEISGKSKDLMDILNSNEMNDIISGYTKIVHGINILVNQPKTAMPAKRAAVGILKNYPEYLQTSSVQDLLSNLGIQIKKRVDNLKYLGEDLRVKINKLIEVLS